MIALVDYGAGNLASVRKALDAIGASVWTPSVPGELGRANGIIVPGVGHFDATKSLTDDWRSAIKTMVDDGTPLLGICVGLQWLFAGSDEAPEVKGLGRFAGTCFHLGDSGTKLKIPHVGWNTLEIRHASPLLRGLQSGAQVYFTHSYAAPVISATTAVCDYGTAFSAAVEDRNVAAVQFHPEKSGDSGLRVLRNFCESVE